jgi:hypothetical protein
MEVLSMSEYDAKYEVDNAIEVCRNGHYEDYRQRQKTWRAKNRQWDRVICMVCAGCGKPLNRYDNLKKHAYCPECRDILFPEVGSPRESFKRRLFYRKTKGDFW